MRAALLCGLSSLALGFGFAAQTASVNGAAAPEYRLPDSKVIRLEGVCGFDDRHISCWGPDRLPAPKLAQAMEDFYVANPHEELPLGFRRKNRLVAFSTTGLSVGVGRPDQKYLQVTESRADFDGRRLCWAPVNASPDERVVSFELHPGSFSAGPPVRVKFANGEKLQYSGALLEVGGTAPAGSGTMIQPSQRATGGRFIPGTFWDYTVRVLDYQGIMFFSYTLFDKSGYEIVEVDGDGNPVRLNHVPEPVKDQLSLPQARAPVMISWLRPVKDATVIRWNVNPDKVGYLGVSGERPLTVLFTDIPLDPK